MNKTIYIILMILAVTTAHSEESRITVTTYNGVVFKNVRIVDNSPDAIIVIDASGIHTLKKSDLDDKSKKVVGYNKEEDVKMREKRKNDGEEFAVYLYEKTKENTEKEKIERAKKLESDRLQAIATAEAAQAAQAESYRRYSPPATTTGRPSTLQRIGSTTFDSNGGTTQRIGNTYFHSDGTSTQRRYSPPATTTGRPSTLQRIGSTTFDSNGGTTHRIGNTYFHSDGTSTQKLGNTYFNSDGGTTQRIGNTQFHSDGTTTQKVGNTYFHSDGSTSQRIGNTIFNNE